MALPNGCLSPGLVEIEPSATGAVSGRPPEWVLQTLPDHLNRLAELDAPSEAC